MAEITASAALQHSAVEAKNLQVESFAACLFVTYLTAAAYVAEALVVLEAVTPSVAAAVDFGLVAVLMHSAAFVAVQQP